ncbi:MAG: hypothetical protein VB100_14460 [Angelakisella sp.]|nr:hypothetical protein [Angelakisella sp.]
MLDFIYSACQMVFWFTVTFIGTLVVIAFDVFVLACIVKSCRSFFKSRKQKQSLDTLDVVEQAEQLAERVNKACEECLHGCEFVRQEIEKNG